MLFWLLLGGLVLATVFWDEIRDAVSNWLHSNNLADSFLMDIFVQFDKVFSGIRATVYGRDYDTEEYYVEERNVSINDIDDPDIIAELEEHGYAETYINY